MKYEGLGKRKPDIEDGADIVLQSVKARRRSVALWVLLITLRKSPAPIPNPSLLHSIIIHSFSPEVFFSLRRKSKAVM